MQKPIQTSDTTFATDILAANRPAVIDFWAEWCAPCHTVTEWMSRLAQALGAQIVVAQVNVDECPQLVANYQVQGVPTILFMREGTVVHHQSTELSEKELRMLVERHLLSTPHAEVGTRK